MGRHIKKGLDYFPLDLSLDDEVEMIEAKYGLEGFAIWIKLLMKIYSCGYYHVWSEREQLLFAGRIHKPIDFLSAFIKDCVSWGLFSEPILKKHGILTSHGIQKRYFAATSRRKKIEVTRTLLIVDPTDYINDPNCLIYVDINSKNGNRGTYKEVSKEGRKEIRIREAEIYQELARHLLQLHLQIDAAFLGKKPADGFIDRAATAFRLLIEQDKREMAEVRAVLDWCKQPDNFWAPIVQSGVGFREKFPKIYAQWKRAHPTAGVEDLQELGRAAFKG